MQNDAHNLIYNQKNIANYNTADQIRFSDFKNRYDDVTIYNQPKLSIKSYLQLIGFPNTQ